jgi:hypothetical protein
MQVETGVNARAGLENDDARAEPAAKERRPPLAPKVSNTRTGPSRRGSDVDMRAKDLRVNTGKPPPGVESDHNRKPVRDRPGQAG